MMATLLRTAAIACLLPTSAFAAGTAPSLVELIDLALKHSPEVSASQAREQEADQSTAIARSGFLPDLSFEAIDSTGFPGSSGLTGVGGLMGSPFRSGPAYGLVLKQIIWDFGRTLNAVAAAKGETETRKAETEVSRYQVELSAMRAYLECSRARSLKDTWHELREESELIAKEIGRFVKTGQRSVVERYLVDAQTEEAVTAEVSFAEQYQAATKLLGVLAGVHELGCSELPANAPSQAAIPETHAGNPSVKRASLDLETAKARLDQARAGHLPQIVGVASVGDVDQARLVEKQSYAVAAGIILPLFDGLKTTSEVRRAEAQITEKESELSAAQQRLDELNSRLDEVIGSLRARLDHLVHEQELAETGFKLAKKRYFAFQGNLVDLREALRNITRTRTQLRDSTAEYMEALESKRLLNG
jgi:outer membrane protein TolC